MPTTSTAEVRFPTVDDFISVFFYHALNFSKLFGRQAVILGQLKIGFQPELCLTVAAVYMNVYPPLLAGEKEKKRKSDTLCSEILLGS